MRNLFRSALMSGVAVLFVALTSGQARADIIYLPGATAPSGGVGHQPESILSIQSPGSTSNAAGGVSWSGNKDVLSGDAKRGEHSKTLTFAQAGITNAGQVRIFMDTEDPDNDLTLNQLVLTAYGSNGQILFQGSLTAPIHFGNELNGQGHGDRVFALDAIQAARLQAAFNSDPNLRLGLFASTSDDTGSFTNFKIGQGPAAVPEPTTMLLFGTGLAGLAARARKRRRQNAEAKKAEEV
ncbi:MAG: motif [Acidobacteriota bacterium]|nr:motif [Acidobacteriota bacterium]MDT7809871.1 motif [Acidobacteriota bacterium]